jgi:hypothetical protein
VTRESLLDDIRVLEPLQERDLSYGSAWDPIVLFFESDLLQCNDLISVNGFESLSFSEFSVGESEYRLSVFLGLPESTYLTSIFIASLIDDTVSAFTEFLHLLVPINIG